MEDPLPWHVQATPRSLADAALLRALEQLYSVTPPTQPDCWLTPRCCTFNTSLSQPRDGYQPLVPCATIVMYQQAGLNARLPAILHRQLYLGRGWCISVNANDTVSLCRDLPWEEDFPGPLDCSRRDGRPPRCHYVLFTSPAAAVPDNWRHVLRRCAATLGRLPWQPHGSNCHTVTHWQLTGRASMSRSISYAWKMGGVLGCVLLAMLLLGVWTAAAAHRRRNAAALRAQRA